MCIGHGILLLIWRGTTPDPDKHLFPAVGDEDITLVKSIARDRALGDEKEIETATLVAESEERRLKVRVILQRIGGQEEFIRYANVMVIIMITHAKIM